MKQCVICIGAGPSQIPYIEKIKSLGYEVICTDGNPQAVGFELAEHFIVSSTFDAEGTVHKLRKLFSEISYDVVGVVAPCTGPPYRTLQQVKKLFGLQYTALDIVDKILDKSGLRHILNSLDCSNIPIFNEKKTLSEEDFPLVKKPRHDGLGGQGVSFYSSFHSYLKNNGDDLMDQNFVYESLIAGREIAIDAVWDGNEIAFLSLGWCLFDRDNGVNVGVTNEGCDELNSLRDNIKQKLQIFCKACRLGPEILNADALLDKSGRVHLIEVEFVPADMLLFSEYCYGCDVIDTFILMQLMRLYKLPAKCLAKGLLLMGGYSWDGLWDKRTLNIEKKCVLIFDGNKTMTNEILLCRDKFNWDINQLIKDISPKVTLYRKNSINFNETI